MAKFHLSQLKTAKQLHEERMNSSPEYRKEWKRTALARAVSELILNYRIREGLTQTEFGRRIELTQAQVSRLESGNHNPTVETLARLAKVLDIELILDITPGQRKRQGLSKTTTYKTLSEFRVGDSQVLLTTAC